MLPDRWLGILSADPAWDVRFERAEDAFVWDDEEDRYLDLFTNGGVNILGHAHPAVNEAVSSQFERLASAHPSIENDAREDFIEALSLVVPAPLSRTVLTNSGSEAVDMALKIACTATRRRRIVAAEGAGHGAGFLAALVSAPHGRPLLPGLGLDVARVPFGDLAALERELGDPVAAFIVEPVQAESGFRTLADSFLGAAHDLCREHDTLLIVDEVQTAFRAWPPLASLRRGVVPDIVCLGPSMANGFPIGAVVVNDDVAARSKRAAVWSTTAGNPLACAAGAATLRTVASTTTRARMTEAGAHLQSRLRGLRMNEIKAVRGEALMAAVELYAGAPVVVRSLWRSGVLVPPAPSGLIRMLPPVTIERAQVDLVVERLAAAILELRDNRRRRRSGGEDVELRGVAARRPSRSG